MATFPNAAVATAGIIFAVVLLAAQTAMANWCVVRSDASNQALQAAIDYACATGADCVPVQANGLCFLPNTIQAHASYAFNSYFQRRNMAPGSCDFSGTATVAKTDPSYGSCVYPSSQSTAGGTIMPGGPGTMTPSGPGITTPTTLPMTAPPATTGGVTPAFGSGGFTPRMGPPIPTTDSYGASPEKNSVTCSVIICISLLIYGLLNYQQLL